MVKKIKNTPFWNVLRRGSAVTLALIVVAMSCFVPISAVDEPTEPTEPVYSEGLAYSFSGTNATVTGPGTWTGGELRIPPQVTVDGVTYAVTAIGADAFKGNTNITSLAMPSTVSSIGSSAFRNCTLLTSVTGGSNLTPGSSAFSGCVTLSSVDFTTWVAILNSCLQGSAFVNIVLPSNIVEIELDSFHSSSLPSSIKTMFLSSPTRVRCYSGFWSSFETLYYSGTLSEYCSCFYNGQRNSRVF
ncbi:MAG: leucine-rich repeat domain-containing protein, partial [Clostridia bacterium]|nr:leucine-rich repeat domain-containing protein [Clostridia bacterium]